MKSNKYYKSLNLKEHYNQLFQKYGNSHLTAQQSSRATQETRMKFLLKGLKIKKNEKILDFGCGTGHLYEYLKKKKLNIYYTGIDVADKIIQYNKNIYKKKPKAKFLNVDILNTKKEIGSYDYVFVSGTFNNKINDNWTWMKECLKFLIKRTKKTLVFNNLSSYVDYYDKNLFYIKPEKVFSFCKKNLSHYVSIANDYQIKNGVIPFEFTTFVHKK